MDQLRIAKIDGAIRALQDAGYGSVPEFLEDLLEAENHAHFEQTADFAVDWTTDLLTREIDVLKRHPACQQPAKSTGPIEIRQFTFPMMANIYSTVAPRLWRLVCTLSAVPPEDAEAFTRDVPEPRVLAEDRSRDSRNKSLNATIILGLIGFCNSRLCNRLQSIMGYYLFATRTGKRTIAVLNRIGAGISYTSVVAALNANAERVQASIRERAGRQPLLYTYDNLTNHNKVTGETLFNKSTFYCFTTAGVVFLQFPVSLASRLGVNTNVLRAAGNLLPHDASLPGESPEEARVRRNLRPTSAGMPTPSDPNVPTPGIARKLLYKENPDWSSLDINNFIREDVMTDYWPEVAKGLICKIVASFFPEEAALSETAKNIAPTPVPTLFKMPVRRSDAHTLRTMKLDEGTVAGNFQVLEDITRKQLGLELDQLNDRVIPVNGDQLTCVRVDAGKTSRCRDCKACRFEWVKTLPGFLHLRMAACNMLYVTHTGKKSYPGSLASFIELLGRTKVKEKCPDLNASHKLLEHVGTAHILALLMRLARVSDVDQFKRVVENGTYVRLVGKLVDEYLPVGKVEGMRRDATAAGRARYTPPEDPPTRIRIPVSTQGDARAELEKQRDEQKARKAAEKEREEKELLRDRDFVHENALLFLRDFLIYWDGYTALRSGDSGRFDRHLQMVGVMFQGIPRLKNYRYATMDFNAKRSVSWTDEMLELWMLNCFVNLDGKPNKFIAIDEYNEWIVRGVKRTYNQLGSFRSTEFTCNVISPNLMALRDSYQGILKSSGAHDWGYRHADVDAHSDVLQVVKDLVDNRVFVRTKGRTRVGSDENAEMLVPSVDTFSEGMEALILGDSIARYVDKKYNDQGATVPDDSPENEEEAEDDSGELYEVSENLFQDEGGFMRGSDFDAS